MDLIYTDDKREDQGILQNYKLDLAYGTDENDFELTVSSKNHVCGKGSIIYIDNTEYGGIIDAIRVDTSSKNIVYKGNTWHGLLESKVIEPDVGEDYLTVSGDANFVISQIINRLGLSSLFKAKSECSFIEVKSYQMNRYVKGYTGIIKMLDTVGGKLKFTFEDGFVILYAEKSVDYSEDDEFDSSQVDFVIEKKFIATNHMICLGKGELKDRVVIHLYADKDGNISHTQSFFGLDERTSLYDNPSVESEEELEKGGMNAMLEERNKGDLQINFDATSEYDIGDIIGAKELTTGITVSRPIAKKIVNITNDLVKINYKVG